jgi:hypothetical protein
MKATSSTHQAINESASTPGASHPELEHQPFLVSTKPATEALLGSFTPLQNIKVPKSQNAPLHVDVTANCKQQQGHVHASSKNDVAGENLPTLRDKPVEAWNLRDVSIWLRQKGFRSRLPGF